MAKTWWNKDKTKVVVASKIREIGTYDRYGQTEVIGWFNGNECFHFGMFDTLAEAQAFVEGLNKEEGGSRG